MPLLPGNMLNQGVGKLWLRAQSCSLLFFVNKVLLEHSHNHSFSYCLRLLSFLLQWQSWVVVRDHLGHKTENSYYLALYRKSMPTPMLNSSDSQHFYPSTPSDPVNPGTAQNDGGQSLMQPGAYPEMSPNLKVFQKQLCKFCSPCHNICSNVIYVLNKQP